ncbi:MAG: type II secretion system F family protein [Candidatus Nanoarchaeia archaeon]
MMKFDKKNLIGVIAAVLIIGGGLIFFRGDKLFFFLIAIALVIGALPFMISFILKQGKQKDKEEKFLEFIQDLVESVKSGTPVSKSILNVRNRDYGALSEHVKKLANQISMGRPLTAALSTFAKDTKSQTIGRAVTLISEAERAGGSIGEVLDAVSSSVSQVDELRKERKSAVYNLVVQGYIIFLVFIVIMLVLEFKILPMTAEISTSEGEFGNMNIQPRKVDPNTFSVPLLIMILIQGFFAGLVIGKISEGSLLSGLKHSFILVALTLLITTGARLFLG